jgi:hypothetical protein
MNPYEDQYDEYGVFNPAAKRPVSVMDPSGQFDDYGGALEPSQPPSAPMPDPRGPAPSGYMDDSEQDYGVRADTEPDVMNPASHGGGLKEALGPAGSGATPGGLPRQTEFEAAIKRRQEHQTSRPKITDEKYKPGWLRTLANMGANFADTYVNMGGRTHTNPEAIKSLSASLAHPGYAKAVQQWEDTGQGIDADLGALTDLSSLDARARKATLEAQQQADKHLGTLSTVDKNKAHADYYRRPATKTMPWGASGSGDIYNKDTGEFRNSPNHKQPAEPPHRNRTAEDVYMDPESTPEQRAAAKEIITQKSAKRGGKAAKPDKDPRAPQRNFLGIEQRKSKDMREYNKELEEQQNIAPNPKATSEERETANQMSAAAKAKHSDKTLDRQRQYLEEIKAAGGSVPSIPRLGLPDFAKKKGISTQEAEKKLLFQGVLVE